jgi:hypothetical protein
MDGSAGETTLLRWLQSFRLQTMVEGIRQQTDKQTRDALKATLPAITPGGTFSHRNEDGLIQHSNFICLDIDLKGNERIRNYAELKYQIVKIIQVAYCGLSVSGHGYFVLIPIAYPDKHLQHFYALQMAFKNFGIKIDDKCKDISRLRGFSFDDNAYFNHTAIPFKGLFTPFQNVQRISSYRPTGDNAILVESVLDQIEQTKSDITEDYNYWFSIGCNFAATFGESGRDYFTE